MMRASIVLVAAVLAAGCLSASEASDEGVAPADPDPVVQAFEGHMTASAAGAVAHQDEETEMMFADLQREGFVLEVIEVPQVLQVDLEWTSAAPTARMFSMVNIPTSTDGAVLDVVSERTGSGAVCMRVPLDEVQPGLVSVMAHSMDAANIDYAIRITTVGGEVVLHADRGHMEVEREDGEQRDAIACPQAEV